MTIAVNIFDLHFCESRPPKEKRMVLNRIKGRLQKLNVSVAEIDHQDLWQRSTLAVVCAGSDRRVVDGTLATASRIVEKDLPGEVLDVQTEYLS